MNRNSNFIWPSGDDVGYAHSEIEFVDNSDDFFNFSEDPVVIWNLWYFMSLALFLDYLLITIDIIFSKLEDLYKAVKSVILRKTNSSWRGHMTTSPMRTLPQNLTGKGGFLVYSKIENFGYLQKPLVPQKSTYI